VRDPLNQADTDRIVESEVRRFHIEGYDDADLRQEARIAVARAMARVRAGQDGAPTYVRRAVRNALSNLLRQAHSASRAPRDTRGRRLRGAFGPIEWAAFLPAQTPSPETIALARQLVAHLQQQAPSDARVLYDVFVEGATASHALRTATGDARDAEARLERARQRAAEILNDLLKKGNT
jgi:hypothetical protein